MRLSRLTRVQAIPISTAQMRVDLDVLEIDPLREAFLL